MNPKNACVDQGWGDTSYNGHPELKTPNLDAMAAAGIPHADGGTGRGLSESFCPKPRHPGNQGFDEWFSAGNWYDIGHEYIYHNGEQVPSREGDTSDVLMDVALEWIGKQAAANKPFLAAIWRTGRGGSQYGPAANGPAGHADCRWHDAVVLLGQWGSVPLVDGRAARRQEVANRGRHADGISLLPLIDGKMSRRPKPIPLLSGQQVRLIDNEYTLQKGRLFRIAEGGRKEIDITDGEPEVLKRLAAWENEWRATVKKDQAAYSVKRRSR